MNARKMIIQEVDIDQLNQGNPIVDYSDGDIVIIDNVRDLTEISPLYAKMNFIILCSKGKIQFDINDRKLMLYQDEVLLSAANVILDNYMISVDFECKILCLSDRIMQGLLRGELDKWNLMVYIRKRNVVKLPSEDKEQFRLYYSLIKYKMDHPRENQSLIMQSIVRAMLLDMCRLVESSVNAQDEHEVSRGRVLFNRFLNMLSHNHVKRQPVGSYALDLCITPKYLSMICHKYSGKSASEWIVEYTMEDIRYNLFHTELSIKEISNKLGFINISLFGTFVRKHFGMSPTELRNREQTK
ncbi:MAG: helix-turn-helix domain-containing protein [Prevotella sp.]|nr:helix-turn-helix domain-containing protein [Prevotella sp.]MCI1281055.1 helix-turn-helix domain-containing protein [Prevotella sp.]